MRFPPALAVIPCVALLAVACRRTPTVTTITPEMQRMVDEQVEKERQADRERELAQREADLNAREQVLNQRERQTQQPVAETTATQEAAPQPNAPAAPAPPPAEAPPTAVQSFYDALSPYGEWMEIPQYGYVWQPADTVRDASWRPYTNGHFAYTDYGWTWISGEAYGWIVYHYGRWMRTSQLRWVWVPGDEWAPAWVSWRYGNDYVGWAPLPPESQFDAPQGIQQWADERYQLGASDYTFVPASEFGDEQMASVAVPPDQNEPLFDDSANVTDIVYASPGIIYCYGPNWDFIVGKSHRRPERLRIARLGFGANNGAFVSNGTLQITSPFIHKGTSLAAPTVLHGRILDTRVVSAAPVARATPPTQMHYMSQPNPAPAAGSDQQQQQQQQRDAAEKLRREAAARQQQISQPRQAEAAVQPSQPAQNAPQPMWAPRVWQQQQGTPPSPPDSGRREAIRQEQPPQQQQQQQEIPQRREEMDRQAAEQRAAEEKQTRDAARAQAEQAEAARAEQAASARQTKAEERAAAAEAAAAASGASPAGHH